VFRVFLRHGYQDAFAYAREHRGTVLLCSESSCGTATRTRLHVLVLWNDVLIDGYNWYNIRMEHDIPFETVFFLVTQENRPPVLPPCATCRPCAVPLCCE